MSLEPDAPRGERLPRTERLRARSDYLRCYRAGRRRHGDLSILYSTRNTLAHPRLGMTVSRKVGGAVTRVRLKRRIREIYRRWRERSTLPALDLVMHLKPPAAKASFDELRAELHAQLESLTPRSRKTS